MERFHVLLRNGCHIHERILARYLRKHGWVVFYLDEQNRECNNGTCWLKLYQSEEKRKELE